MQEDLGRNADIVERGVLAVGVGEGCPQRDFANMLIKRQCVVRIDRDLVLGRIGQRLAELARRSHNSQRTRSGETIGAKAGIGWI